MILISSACSQLHHGSLVLCCTVYYLPVLTTVLGRIVLYNIEMGMGQKWEGGGTSLL